MMECQLALQLFPSSQQAQLKETRFRFRTAPAPNAVSLLHQKYLEKVPHANPGQQNAILTCMPVQKKSRALRPQFHWLRAKPHDARAQTSQIPAGTDSFVRSVQRHCVGCSNPAHQQSVHQQPTRHSLYLHSCTQSILTAAFSILTKRG